MRVLIEGREPAGRVLARLLSSAGHEVSLERSDAGGLPDAIVLTVSGGGDLERVRTLSRMGAGAPLLILTRIALPMAAEVEDLGVTLMFPGFGKGSPGLADQRRSSALGLPGTVVGPMAGRPRAVDRRLVELLRSAGIRASLRGDMQAWLTVTSAWLGPLRGAMAAAAQQGHTLDAKPDLVTLAARAARERLRLVKGARLPLPPACFCLLTLPESWAIATVREVARILRDVSDLPCIPSREEAALVAARLKVIAREHGIRTPAADFLDGFTREEAGRTNDRGAGAGQGPGTRTHPGRC